MLDLCSKPRVPVDDLCLHAETINPSPTSLDPTTLAPATPPPTTLAPTTPAPTTSDSVLEFVSDVRLEVGDDITILGCSESWIYVESPSSPTIEADELLLITNVHAGVSYSDNFADSCECFPLMRRIVGIEASPEHDGISCSGSKCWILTSELLSPLDTISATDVDGLGLSDVQYVPWESFLGKVCVPSETETSGRKLLGECSGRWEGKSDGSGGGSCPHNDCLYDRCYECSERGCDNGCGPDTFPGIVTEFLAVSTEFGDACCNHDYCYVATAEKGVCDSAFLYDALAGCRRIRSVLLFDGFASCNLVAFGLFAAVVGFGDTAFAKAVATEKKWKETCRCVEPEKWDEKCESCVDPEVSMCCDDGSTALVVECCPGQVSFPNCRQFFPVFDDCQSSGSLASRPQHYVARFWTAGAVSVEE